MSLFNFFNKKNDKKEAKAVSVELSNNALFEAMKPYYEHLMYFSAMQQHGNYAPISAYEKTNGEVVGFLYVIDESGAYSMSSEDAIKRMEARFEKELAADEIKSYAIMYHSQYDKKSPNHDVAVENDELKAISIAYNFKHVDKGYLALPYEFDREGLNYLGFDGFSHAEMGAIFNTELDQEKNYFEDRETMEVPTHENEIGLKITISNAHSLHNTWSGIFGYERYNQPNGSQVLMEYYALAMSQIQDKDTSGVVTHLTEFDDVDFKSVFLDAEPVTILPVVKTDYVLDIEHKEIQEWENTDNMEAIISGRARDTFGVWYYATDYAQNRNRYRSEKQLNVHLSGLAFVVDIHKSDDNDDTEPKLSEDFTGYFPSKDVPHFGCFDFIGELKDFRETSVLDGGEIRAYIMNIKLINNEEFDDFFTIDMYVNTENMRFKTLSKGMKLTGMFQLQGYISEA